MLFLPDEKGQGLAEYAFLLMMMALVLIALVTLVGAQTHSLYSNVVSSLPEHM